MLTAFKTSRIITVIELRSLIQIPKLILTLAEKGLMILCSGIITEGPLAHES